MRAKIGAPLLLAIVVVGLLGNCSSEKVNALTGRKKSYAVSAKSTAFYHYGPLQGGGPNKTLPKNTIVALTFLGWHFSKVKLETGEEGYVATEDIRPASSQLLVISDASHSKPASSGDASTTVVDPNSIPPPERVVDPRFEPTPIPNPPEH